MSNRSISTERRLIRTAARAALLRCRINLRHPITLRRERRAERPPLSRRVTCDSFSSCSLGLLLMSFVQYCHKLPKYSDGTTTHSFCGKTCAQKAKATGTTSAQAKSVGLKPNALAAMLTVLPFRPVKNGCLLCGNAVKKGHFCGKGCTSKAEKKAPALLEVPQGHDTFKNGM